MNTTPPQLRLQNLALLERIPLDQSVTLEEFDKVFHHHTFPRPLLEMLEDDEILNYYDLLSGRWDQLDFELSEFRETNSFSHVAPGITQEDMIGTQKKMCQELNRIYEILLKVVEICNERGLDLEEE